MQILHGGETKHSSTENVFLTRAKLSRVRRKFFAREERYERGGTTQRNTFDRRSRHMTCTVWVGNKSAPMSKSCETMREPGRSSRKSLGGSRRFMLYERYNETTVASERSTSNKSSERNVTRSATPALRACSLLRATSDGSISMPTPRAPKSRAAAITMRPSPEPRS